MASNDEKTEAPTPRKRTEAREEGNVAKSQDLSSSIILLGAMFILAACGHHLITGLQRMVCASLSGEWSHNVANSADLPHVISSFAVISARIILPIMLSIAAIAIASNLIQTGFNVSIKSLKPKFNRLSPLKGISNLFSLRKVMKLAMDLLKLAIIVAIVAVTIYFDMPRVISLVYLQPAAALAAASSLVFSLAMRIGLMLLILGILDFIYQKWQHEQELRMTKQEVKEDFKRMEGDPLMKQRRARIARQLSMQRIAQNVPQADVIVTNPTHFAIALKYDGETMAAPKLVAKGADFLALRIRQIAIANNIPIVERKELAQALYHTVDVGMEIPPQHFAAVAEILAYVYRLSGKRIA